jgi:hypothetical protein
MRADQNIVVGGTLNGKREVFGPMPANDAIPKYYELSRKGYLQITMTDADTGHDYNVGGVLSAQPIAKQ